jgi:hypothetical protein
VLWNGHGCDVGLRTVGDGARWRLLAETQSAGVDEPVTRGTTLVSAQTNSIMLAACISRWPPAATIHTTWLGAMRLLYKVPSVESPRLSHVEASLSRQQYVSLERALCSGDTGPP